MSFGEKEQKQETPTDSNTIQFDRDKYFEGMAQYTSDLRVDRLSPREKSIIVFALGRTYMLCQLLGQDSLGTFGKGDFKSVAEKLGAKIS